jgi:hypothetical protein
MLSIKNRISAGKNKTSPLRQRMDIKVLFHLLISSLSKNTDPTIEYASSLYTTKTTRKIKMIPKIQNMPEGELSEIIPL